MSQGKILIDGVIFQLQYGKPGGISRVWQNHITNLVNSTLKNRILLLDRTNTLPEFPGLSRIVIDPYHPQAFEADSLYLQKILDQEGGDLLISTYYTYPENSPGMIMLHDMTPEIMGLDLNYPEWRAKTKAIQKACAYLAVSQSTRKDFHKLHPEEKHKPITIIPNAASETFQQQTSADIKSFHDSYGIQKPYFLLVGKRGGYKNAQIFFRAFSRLENPTDYEIFCTGGQSRLENSCQELLQGARCQVQHLSDRGLALAYAGALCLVYPSLYEGFGLPILEAQQSGCPVITYQNSSLAEVGGAGALYPEMHDVESLKEALVQVQKKDLREQLILTGHKNAQRYSWEKSTERLIEAIENIFQNLPAIPRNPTASLHSGVRLAYNLSTLPQTRKISRCLQDSVELISSNPLTIDFQALVPLEDQITQHLTDPLIKELQDLAQSPQSDSFIHYWLGLGYLKKDQPQLALEAFLNSIQSTFETSRAAYLAARLAYELEDWKLAGKLWQSLAGLHHPDAEKMLALIQQDSGEKPSPRREHNQLHTFQKPARVPPIKIPWDDYSDPLVTFILPTKDRSPGAREFLESLPAAVQQIPYEVLIYAGNDADQTFRDLDEQQPITSVFRDEDIFEPQEKFSWAKLMNHGFSQARGEWICYGSDDIQLYPFAVTQALAPYLDQEQIGGITFLHRNTVQTFGNYYRNFGFDVFDGKTFINFGLIRKQAYQDTSGFDEDFNFYWADVDLCLQIWEAGYKIVPSPYSLVDHHNQDDSIRKENSQQRYINDTNTFFEKWSGNPLFTTERVLDRDRYILPDAESREMIRELEAREGERPSGGSTRSNGKETHHGQNSGQEQPAWLLARLLDAPDIAAAVQRNQQNLSPELLKLIDANIRQADRDGNPELAEGLTILSEFIQDHFPDRIRVS